MFVIEVLIQGVISILSFHGISKECCIWLDAQPSVKEETLTDWILYQASLNSKKVFYKAFKRNEEALNGADWEWWILTDSGYQTYAYRLLIQAKKLNGFDNYGAVTYGNRNGMQIDLLLNSALERQAYPLYAYYTCTQPNIKEQINNFNNVDEKIIRWCEKCINGAYLSPAKEIRHRIIESPKRKISDNELVDYSLGLSMLDLIINNAPDGIKLLDLMDADFIQNFNAKEINNAKHGIRYSIENAPQYLRTFIKNNYELQRVDWFESEFRYDLKNISGIAVIDARKN